MDIQEFFENGHKYNLPNLSIDIVIIGYQEQELKCLLLQIGDKWMLPGGYIQLNESVDKAAYRILKDRTGLEEPHLEFLSVFGDKDRSFGEQFKKFSEKFGIPWRSDYWVNSRFVTLAYYSLVDIQNTFPVAGNYDEGVAWFSFDNLPDMWIDHKTIVTEARQGIKAAIKQGLITYDLLPDTFTMPELHQLHQTILEEELDRSRFQKKMLSTGIFERLPKLQKGAPGRNPYQYRVKPK